jgi:thiol:disulfide interchange protein DsbD
VASISTASISTTRVQTALTANQNQLSVEQDAGAIASLLANSEGYWVVLTFLVLGLGLTFTPCVLPMVPILAGIIAGQGEKITVRKGVGLSAAYVLGMSVTYTIAGVLVGYFGAKMNLQASLQSPLALIIFASLFSVLALSMFGFYELQLPSFLRDRLDRMGQKSKGGQYMGVALMGLISALVVSPCVSAPLAGALVYISTTGDALLGGASLFALSLGMGLPLILVGAGGGQWLPRAGGWMLEVKAFFGVLLLGVAISLLSRLLPGTITLLLWALLAIVYAVHLGGFGQNTVLSGWGKTRRGLSIALLVYGISLLLAGLAGQNDPLRPLAFASAPTSQNIQHEQPLFSRYDSVVALKAAMEQANQQHKPVVIDLYADWCASCKVMEKEVFNRPSVKSFADKIVFLQLDITDNNQEQSAFLQEHGLFGPPSLLFYQANGQELDSARIQGELGPQQFIQQVQKVL